MGAAKIAFATALCAFLFGAAQAQEVETYAVGLQGDVFSPADLKIPANKPFILKIANQEAAAVEFEAKGMGIEKIAPAGAEIIVHVRPLKPGHYKLVNEYREDIAKIELVVE